MVAPLNAWPVTYWEGDEDTLPKYGTAILADGGPEAESTGVLVIDSRTRKGRWVPVDQIEWGDVPE